MMAKQDELVARGLREAQEQRKRESAERQAALQFRFRAADLLDSVALRLAGSPRSAALIPSLARAVRTAAARAREAAAADRRAQSAKNDASSDADSVDESRAGKGSAGELKSLSDRLAGILRRVCEARVERIPTASDAERLAQSLLDALSNDEADDDDEEEEDDDEEDDDDDDDTAPAGGAVGQAIRWLVTSAGGLLQALTRGSPADPLVGADAPWAMIRFARALGRTREAAAGLVDGLSEDEEGVMSLAIAGALRDFVVRHGCALSPATAERLTRHLPRNVWAALPAILAPVASSGNAFRRIEALGWATTLYKSSARLIADAGPLPRVVSNMEALTATADGRAVADAVLASAAQLLAQPLAAPRAKAALGAAKEVLAALSGKGTGALLLPPRPAGPRLPSLDRLAEALASTVSTSASEGVRAQAAALAKVLTPLRTATTTETVASSSSAAEAAASAEIRPRGKKHSA